MAVQGVSVRGRSLGSKHAAQHGQSLDVADVAVVIQPGEDGTRVAHWWDVPRLQRGRSRTHSVSSKRRPNGCLAQGVSVSGSESGLRS